ncbi:MAG: hypothetical protein DRJ03_17605 [Chloroflexi bacterium]|nr:MAG: hypothetical protein DRJ03_17605 [Chloroflexota bacterium]
MDGNVLLWREIIIQRKDIVDADWFTYCRTCDNLIKLSTINDYFIETVKPFVDEVVSDDEITIVRDINNDYRIFDRKRGVDDWVYYDVCFYLIDYFVGKSGVPITYNTYIECDGKVLDVVTRYVAKSLKQVVRYVPDITKLNIDVVEIDDVNALRISIRVDKEMYGHTGKITSTILDHIRDGLSTLGISVNVWDIIAESVDVSTNESQTNWYEWGELLAEIRREFESNSESTLRMTNEDMSVLYRVMNDE